MGGRGSKSGFSWKKQLHEMAQKGEIPHYIMGSSEVQSRILKEIDKLYSMPQTNAQIVDQGTGVWVSFNGKVSRSSYPSGEAASEAEKRGALKMLLHNRLKG